MKFLLLIIVLCLGYAAYTHWEHVEPVLTQVSTRATKAVSSGETTAATATATAVQPSAQAPAVAVPNVPKAPAQTPLAALVAESQRAAVAKYPALSVVNSEMNSRFVFRYKHLLADHDARLQDPNWPLQLADECAASAGIKPKLQALPAASAHQGGSLVASQR